MTLSVRALLLAGVCCLTGAATCLAAMDPQAGETAPARVRDRQDGRVSGTNLSSGEDAGPRFLVKEVRISGNTLIPTPELYKDLPLEYTVGEDMYDFRVLHEIIASPGRERRVSLKTIQGLTKYILSKYKDYAGIYVYVPAKAVEDTAKLKDGILEIEVLEGRVARITVDRYDLQDPNQRLLEPGEEPVEPGKRQGFLKSSVLKSWSPATEGDVIKTKELDDFVGLLNLNPDRYIRHYVSRSRDPNALNLNYDIYEANPWHWYLQADNSGTRDRQWAPRLAVVNTNVSGMDDRFSAVYQAPWEKGIEDEYSVFGSYDFPLFRPSLRCSVYGGYSEFDITPEGGAGINFLGNGSFYGTVLSYNVLQTHGWFVDVTASLSKEKSKVTPSLGLASDVDMNLWGVGLNIHRSDANSTSSLTLNRFESISASSKDEFELARPNADPDFTIYNVAVAHSQFLDPKKVNRLRGSFRFVTSDERLVPAKMTTFGGLYSVRGYEEDEIVADGGLLLSGQYEFDFVKHGQSASNDTDSMKTQGTEPWLKKLAPLAFVDYGRAKIKSHVTGEKGTHELCSVGVGMIAELEGNFGASLYLGWPLRATDETDEGDVRLNASLIKRF